MNIRMRVQSVSIVGLVVPMLLGDSFRPVSIALAGRVLAMACLLSLSSWSGLADVRADEWPQFRGPQGNGHVDAPGLPVDWSEHHNITWKTALPGRGHSSPVVAGGQIWFTTAIASPLSEEAMQARLAQVRNPNGLEVVGELSLRALCYDLATGEQRFDIEVFQPSNPEPIHHTNTYASPTPVIHAGRVFVHYGTYGTAAIDTRAGEVLWRVANLNIDHQNGPGSSPIVWDNLLITHYDGTDRQFLAALNVEDGSLVWRTERSGEMDPKPEFQKAYCTPTLIETARGPELISPAANWVYGYHPATGSEIWKATYGELGFSTVPKPVVGHGLTFICTSFMRSRLLAVRLGGEGDVSRSHIEWSSDSQIPKKPSLMLVGNELFVANDAGIVTCFEATTGKEIWRERIGGNYASSPMYGNGLIYFFSEEGRTTVIRAAREFEIVQVNELASGFNASPAVVGNSLILRTKNDLYRIDASEAERQIK